MPQLLTLCRAAAPAGWIDDFVAAAREQGAPEENMRVNPIDSD